MATRLILEKSGYEVFLAEDGKSGVDMVKICCSRSGYCGYDDGNMGGGF